MQIEVNGVVHQIHNELTLEQLLHQLDKLEKGIAVAINEAIIPRSLWPEQKFSEDDKIAIFRAIAGG